MTQASPAANKLAPIATRQNIGPGRSFSAVTMAVKAATHRTSMTATAKSSSISPVQQAMQNTPCRSPMPAAPSLPSRHSLKMNPVGERQ
jgi:hypothetical protein